MEYARSTAGRGCYVKGCASTVRYRQTPVYISSSVSHTNAKKPAIVDACTEKKNPYIPSICTM